MERSKLTAPVSLELYNRAYKSIGSRQRSAPLAWVVESDTAHAEGAAAAWIREDLYQMLLSPLVGSRRVCRMKRLEAVHPVRSVNMFRRAVTARYMRR